jgi:hypothetical protein
MYKPRRLTPRAATRLLAMATVALSHDESQQEIKCNNISVPFKLNMLI